MRIVCTPSITVHAIHLVFVHSMPLWACIRSPPTVCLTIFTYHFSVDAHEPRPMPSVTGHTQHIFSIIPRCGPVAAHHPPFQPPPHHPTIISGEPRFTSSQDLWMLRLMRRRRRHRRQPLRRPCSAPPETCYRNAAWTAPSRSRSSVSGTCESLAPPCGSDGDGMEISEEMVAGPIRITSSSCGVTACALR